jgi:hypothetical protein
MWHFALNAPTSAETDLKATAETTRVGRFDLTDGRRERTEEHDLVKESRWWRSRCAEV